MSDPASAGSRADRKAEARLRAMSRVKRRLRGVASPTADIPILELALTGAIDEELFGTYLGKFVYRGRVERLADFVAAPGLDARQRTVLSALDKSERGRFAEAIAELQGLTASEPAYSPGWYALWRVADLGEEAELSLAAGMGYLKAYQENAYRFAGSLAFEAERLQARRAFRFSMRRALADAEAAPETPRFFRKQYGRLAMFWLRLFDLDRARQVAALAVERELAGAEERLAELDELVARSEPFRALVDGAREDLGRRVRREKLRPAADAIEVVVATAAVVMKTSDNPLLRPSLRLIYSQIAEVAAESGRPVEVRSKLNSQSAVRMRRDRCTISYHTEAPNRHGLHFKEAYQPGVFTFDRRGYSGWAEICDVPLEAMPLQSYAAADVEAFHADLHERFVRSNASKYAQADLSEPPAEEPGYVFVALQLPNDSVQRLAWVDMLAMLDEVAAHCRSAGLRLVVKRHPLCRSPIVAARLAQGVEAGEFVLSERSIHQLIENALAVCCVNSGVGFEALLHLKPVYLFGRADYMHVCHRVERPGAFAEVFMGAALPVSGEVLKRYLRHLFEAYMVDCGRPETAAPKIRRHVERYIRERRGLGAPADDDD